VNVLNQTESTDVFDRPMYFCDPPFLLATCILYMSTTPQMCIHIPLADIAIATASCLPAWVVAKFCFSLGDADGSSCDRSALIVFPNTETCKYVTRP